MSLHLIFHSVLLSVPTPITSTIITLILLEFLVQNWNFHKAANLQSGIREGLFCFVLEMSIGMNLNVGWDCKGIFSKKRFLMSIRRNQSNCNKWENKVILADTYAFWVHCRSQWLPWRLALAPTACNAVVGCRQTWHFPDTSETVVANSVRWEFSACHTLHPLFGYGDGGDDYSAVPSVPPDYAVHGWLRKPMGEHKYWHVNLFAHFAPVHYSSSFLSQVPTTVLTIN